MPIQETFRNHKIRSIIRESWYLSWPMTLIMFFIFLIGLADVYIAGKIGKEVQAAYGLSFQIYFIFLVLEMALAVGAVSVISRLFTSGDRQKFETAVTSSMVLCFVVGVFFSALGFLLAGFIIRNLNVPEALKSYGITFMRIYSLGLVFHYLMINSNGILRASGSIMKSLLTMGIVCSLNVGLNFFLSFHTPLGFKGIAVSTVISLMIGTIINAYYIRKLIKGALSFSFSLVKKIFHIGWPAGILQILWQLGAMALFLIIARLPEHSVETMAAFTNGLKIESAIFLPAFAFNMANAVIVGNLLGKKEKEEAFHSGIVTAVLGVIIVTALTLFVLVNARTVASFLSKNDMVINESMKYIYISLIAEPFMAWGVILGGGLNGAGDTRSVMRIVSLSIWLLRVPLSYFLAVHLRLGAVAIWWSMNFSIIVQSFFLSRKYLSRTWIEYSEKRVSL